jgi:hypothetical protein
MKPYIADSIPVFAGPTLADWQAHPPFARYPPAAAGDMLHLANGAACTVLLIDGYFDARRSVWHKEILILLSRGFRVIGAASMGALRAAELAPFGMIGYGAIFEAFAQGRITADDEVAVVHAPPDLSSAPFSVAQVDVRAVLVRAVRLRVISADVARSLRDLSHAIHYRDRTWSGVITAGKQAGLLVGPLATWLLANRFSQKTCDATGALMLALELAPLRPRPHPDPPMTGLLRQAAQLVGVRLG